MPGLDYAPSAGWILDEGGEAAVIQPQRCIAAVNAVLTTMRRAKKVWRGRDSRVETGGERGLRQGVRGGGDRG
eukprot:365229-Chlamydomonas_euryale.AAC.2